MNNLSYISDNCNILFFDVTKYNYPNININNRWNKFGLIPKIKQFDSSPYDHTMYLDVDMNILKNFTHLWNDYHKSNDDLYIGGYSDNSNKGRSKWHWHTLYDVIESSNINIPEISSTAFYNNKFKDYMKNDNNLHYIFNNISNWSVKKQFRGDILMK